MFLPLHRQWEKYLPQHPHHKQNRVLGESKHDRTNRMLTVPHTRTNESKRGNDILKRKEERRNLIWNKILKFSRQKLFTAKQPGSLLSKKGNKRNKQFLVASSSSLLPAPFPSLFFCCSIRSLQIVDRTRLYGEYNYDDWPTNPLPSAFETSKEKERLPQCKLFRYSNQSQ